MKNNDNDNDKTNETSIDKKIKKPKKKRKYISKLCPFNETIKTMRKNDCSYARIAKHIYDKHKLWCHPSTIYRYTIRYSL